MYAWNTEGPSVLLVHEYQMVTPNLGEGNVAEGRSMHTRRPKYDHPDNQILFLRSGGMK